MKILLATWGEGIRGELMWCIGEVICYSLRISIIFAFWRLFLIVCKLNWEKRVVYRPGTGKSLVVFRILSNCFPYIFLFSSLALFGQTVNEDVRAILPELLDCYIKSTGLPNGQKCAQGEKMHRFLYRPIRGPTARWRHIRILPYTSVWLPP